MDQGHEPILTMNISPELVQQSGHFLQRIVQRLDIVPPIFTVAAFMID